MQHARIVLAVAAGERVGDLAARLECDRTTVWRVCRRYEQGGLTRHPMAPTWPLELLSVFTFEEQPGGKTKFTIRWSPHNATEEERKTFDAGHAGMNQGWGGSLEQLEAYLAKAKT